MQSFLPALGEAPIEEILRLLFGQYTAAGPTMLGFVAGWAPFHLSTRDDGYGKRVARDNNATCMMVYHSMVDC